MTHPNRHPGAGVYTNAHQIAAQMRARSAAAEAAGHRVVRTYGQLLLTRVRANASGRPGPRAVTGDYRRSWNVQYVDHAGRHSATVGTAAPQARRLEYGFVGADRLGRVYNQPPFPHVGPAVLTTAPEFRDALARAGVLR